MTVCAWWIEANHTKWICTERTQDVTSYRQILTAQRQAVVVRFAHPAPKAKRPHVSILKLADRVTRMPLSTGGKHETLFTRTGPKYFTGA